METRYFSIFSDDNRIEFYNSIWGKETITYNGEVVSESNSIMGDVHRFYVDEEGEEVEYEVNVYLKGFRVAYDVYRNDVALFLS